MAMIDGPIDYSGNGDLLRRILKSNSTQSGPGIRTNFQSGSTGFHESQGPSHSPPLQSPGGLNIPNVKYREHTASVTSHNHSGFSTDHYIANSNQNHSRNSHHVNSINSSFQDEEYESSPTQRYVNSAHSLNMPHANTTPANSGNEYSNGMLIDISELVDLDSLTPANLCRLSFIDLANLTIVSLVQLQKYGQIISSLQQDVSSLREELENQKSDKKSKKQPTSSVTSSPKIGVVSGSGSTPQLSAMLEKLPPGKLKDCVECSYKIDDTRRRTSFMCRVCLLGVHRNSSCWYQHGCWKSLSKEQEEEASPINDGMESNYDLDDCFNGTIDYSSHGNTSFADSSFEATGSPTTSVGGGVKRNGSMPLSQAIKKVRRVQCKVESIFLHCINRMKEGSRKECSSCSNRKAGKRQRSRYMCSKCGKGLHGRGSCITIHPCWQDEFQGWTPVPHAKDIPETTGSVEVGGVAEVTEVDVGGDAMETVDDIKQEPREDSLGYLDYSGGQGELSNDQSYDQGNEEIDSNIHPVPNDCLEDAVGDESPVATEMSSAALVTADVSNAAMQMEVHKEFQADIANVIKALDEV